MMPKRLLNRDHDVESYGSNAEAYLNLGFEEIELEEGSSRCQTPSTDVSHPSSSHRPIVILASLEEEETPDSDEEEELTDKQKREKQAKQFENILWVSCVGFMIFLPLLMTFIGFIFVNSCPTLPSLPVILMITGGVMTAGNSFNLFCGILDSSRFKRRTNSNSQNNCLPSKQLVASRGNACINILTLFLWLTLSTWIHLHSRPPSFVPDSRDERNETTTQINFVEKTGSMDKRSGINLTETSYETVGSTPVGCSHVLYLFSLYLVNSILILMACLAVINGIGHLGVVSVCSTVWNRVSGKRKSSSVVVVDDERTIETTSTST